MTRRAALFALLAAALPSHAGRASLPEMPPILHYYGPVRICQPGPSPFYAVDVLLGEAVEVQGGNIAISWEGGGLGIGPVSGPAGSKVLGEAVEDLGEIAVSDAGIAQRIRVQGRVRYRVNPGTDQYWGWVGIGSTGFDGSDRDLVILKRIKFGSEARAACADVPEPLRATPERQNWMAMWLSPRRHPGPFTLCLDYLAFDVRAGETVMLPWNDIPMARVDAAGRQVAITAGLHPLGSPHAWPVVSGAVVDDARLTAFSSTDSTTGNMLLPARPAIEMRIMSKADLERFGPKGGGHVTFSFNTDPGEAERSALARRLRVRGPADRCYKPGKSL